MADNTRFNFRIDARLLDAFERVAKANDRTPSQLLRDFARDYVRRHPDAQQFELSLPAPSKEKT